MNMTTLLFFYFKIFEINDIIDITSDFENSDIGPSTLSEYFWCYSINNSITLNKLKHPAHH